MQEKLKDNLFSNFFSLIFGAVLTALLFVVTSHPTDPEGVRTKLVDISLGEIEDAYGSPVTESKIDKQFASELEVGGDNSIILVGSATVNNKLYRWISIFEREPPGTIDTVVGRSGFFGLSSITTIEAPSTESFVIDDIEESDLDGDGTLEVHVRVKSVWADSVSVGPLIFSKDDISNWHVYTLPSISEVLSSPVETPAGSLEAAVRRPFLSFGMIEDDEAKPKPQSDLRQLDVSEDSWTLNHNGKEQSFSILRNGGDYIIREHAIKGHSQLQTLAFLVDGRAVLNSHYAVVNMFKFGEGSIETDDLWNWGHPMYSVRPLRLLDIDMDSISKAGIRAHTIGDVFYGYTEFEKVRVQ